MEKYDYYEAVESDVKDYIEEHYDHEELIENLRNREKFEEELNEDCWVADSVTGNASGSYTFNTWQAEEYICHNMELLGEALGEFCCKQDYLEKGAEACDVTIRCYLLNQSIHKVLDELCEEYEEEIDAEEGGCDD